MGNITKITPAVLRGLSPSSSEGSMVAKSGDEFVYTKTLSGFSYSGELTTSSTSSLQIPYGNTAQRPSGGSGKIRFNTTLSTYEGYYQLEGVWKPLSGLIADTINEPVDGWSNVVAFLESGTYSFTVPENVFRVALHVTGGGGNGSSSNNTALHSSGGGGGFAYGVLPVVPGQVITDIIVGGQGQASSITGQLSASAGSSASGATPGVGGSGSIINTGLLNQDIAAGGSGTFLSSDIARGGSGAGSRYGDGGSGSTGNARGGGGSSAVGGGGGLFASSSSNGGGTVSARPGAGRLNGDVKSGLLDLVNKQLSGSGGKYSNSSSTDGPLGAGGGGGYLQDGNILGGGGGNASGGFLGGSGGVNISGLQVYAGNGGGGGSGYSAGTAPPIALGGAGAILICWAPGY